MKSSFLLSVVIGINVFLTACAGINQGSAVKQDPPVFNDNIIQSGREEAKKNGRNPIPISANKQGTIAVAPGTGIRFQNSQIVLLDEGNMIFNVGEFPLTYAGVNLMPGEYGIVENRMLIKKPDKLSFDANPINKTTQESMRPIQATLSTPQPELRKLGRVASDIPGDFHWLMGSSGKLVLIQEKNGRYEVDPIVKTEFSRI